MKFLIKIGITLSTISMSLENLFSMRPKGVVSKNHIGNLTMLCTRLLCETLATFKHPIASITDAKIKVIAGNLLKLKIELISLDYFKS